MNKIKPEIIIKLEEAGLDLLEVVKLKGKDREQAVEKIAYVVAKHSIKKHLDKNLPRYLDEFFDKYPNFRKEYPNGIKEKISKNLP